MNEAENYIDPLTVQFFHNNGTSSISVILLTNGRKDGRKDGQINGREFNTSLMGGNKGFSASVETLHKGNIRTNGLLQRTQPRPPHTR